MPRPLNPVCLISSNTQRRSQIAEVLRGAGRTVEEYFTAREFLIDVPRTPRATVICDRKVIGMSSIQLALELQGKAEYPFVMIGGIARPNVLLCNNLYDVEVCGILPNEVLAAVRRVENRQFEHPTDLKRLFANLTTRDLTVLKLSVAGLTNAQVGKSMGIDTNRAQTYRSILVAMTNCTDVMELARKWRALCEIDPSRNH
jgi:FixJ family two-component response regulator